MRRLGLFLWTASLLLNAAAISASEPPANAERVERALLAPCCFSQSVAEHNSAEAERMRREIAQRVARGESEQQILDEYVAQYGRRILVVPNGTEGKVLITTPLVATCGAVLLLALFLRKRLVKTPVLHPSVPLVPLAESDRRKYLSQVERDTQE
jgi:cytochrome c-type biogenesis protein CcmH/NrfF